MVETNTFGASRMVLAEYGLEDKVEEINRTAARLAREVARRSRLGTGGGWWPERWGPRPSCRRWGTSALTRWLAAYVEQARGLIEGGADVLLVETCQDILQAKAAWWAFEAMRLAQGSACRCKFK